VSHIIGADGRGRPAGSRPLKPAPGRACGTKPTDPSPPTSEARRRHTPAQLREEFAEVTAASMARRRASNRRADEITDGRSVGNSPTTGCSRSGPSTSSPTSRTSAGRSVGRHLDGRAAALAEGLILEVLNGTLRRRVAALEGHRVRIESPIGRSSWSSAERAATPRRHRATAARPPVREQTRRPTTSPPATAPVTTPRRRSGCRSASSWPLPAAAPTSPMSFITIDGDKQLADEVLAQMGFTP